MPYRTCRECSKGLRGMEGHRAIFMERFTTPDNPGEPLFRCFLCGTHWRRGSGRDDAFNWEVVFLATSAD